MRRCKVCGVEVSGVSDKCIGCMTHREVEVTAMCTECREVHMVVVDDWGMAPCDICKTYTLHDVAPDGGFDGILGEG